MRPPLLALVGRPNVGKSTLFNRLVGGRPALVHDTPGLTRDRRYGDVDYFGSALRVVDTGGLDPDAELANRLRATGKPLFLVVNKIDHPTRDDLVHEFHELGIGTAYAVSAAH